ncbi:MAG: glycosyltransferase family 2 protein [Calothrix sp. MO_167.B42]|nr:glycosyltransferase family 2 protein [Calothrix sp. MO_167.B42]
MQQHKTLCSIILVNYNGADVLLDCLNSIEKFIPKHNLDIIVVDNASQDDSRKLIADKFPHIHLIKLPENRGFGAGNNAGASIATGEFLLLLNTDTILTENILPHLIDLMYTNPQIGIVGPKLLNADGSFQVSFAHTISIQGEYQTLKLHQAAKNPSQLKIIEQQYQDIQEVDVVVGAALLIRSSLFQALGGFDENFFMYFEESDLCQRVRNQGYKIVYTPHVSLIHLKGYSTQQAASPMAIEYRRSQMYYYYKHRPSVEQLLVRVYLFVKFLFEWLRTTNPNSWKMAIAIMTFKPGKFK